MSRREVHPPEVLGGRRLPCANVGDTRHTNGCEEIFQAWPGPGPHPAKEWLGTDTVRSGDVLYFLAGELELQDLS